MPMSGNFPSLKRRERLFGPVPRWTLKSTFHFLKTEYPMFYSFQWWIIKVHHKLSVNLWIQGMFPKTSTYHNGPPFNLSPKCQSLSESRQQICSIFVCFALIRKCASQQAIVCLFSNVTNRIVFLLHAIGPTTHEIMDLTLTHRWIRFDNVWSLLEMIYCRINHLRRRSNLFKWALEILKEDINFVYSFDDFGIISKLCLLYWHHTPWHLFLFSSMYFV